MTRGQGQSKDGGCCGGFNPLLLLLLGVHDAEDRVVDGAVVGRRLTTFSPASPLFATQPTDPVWRSRATFTSLKRCPFSLSVNAMTAPSSKVPGRAGALFPH